MAGTMRIGLSHITRRRVVVGVGAFLVIWVLFFDSHSVLDRFLWHVEANTLEIENQELREEIQQINTEIEHADDPEVVERVARESYGMRKDGETVYRVEESND